MESGSDAICKIRSIKRTGLGVSKGVSPVKIVLISFWRLEYGQLLHMTRRFVGLLHLLPQIEIFFGAGTLFPSFPHQILPSRSISQNFSSETRQYDPLVGLLITRPLGHVIE